MQLNASDGRAETARPASVWTQISSESAETTFLRSAGGEQGGTADLLFPEGQEQKAETSEDAALSSVRLAPVAGAPNSWAKTLNWAKVVDQH